MKLKQEEREFLSELVTSPGWYALVKEIDNCVERFEENVKKYDLNQSERGLTIVAAKAEGARLLRRNIQEIKAKFSKSTDSGL